MIIGESLLSIDQEISWFAEQSVEAGLIHGDWTSCLEYLSKLQKLTGFDKRILFLQARALCALERFDEAATVLTSLMISSYRSSGLYHCLGAISLKRNRFEESARYFTKAIEKNYGNFIDPSIICNYEGRAQAYIGLGLTSEADKDLIAIAHLNLFEEARVHYLAGRYEFAEKCIEALPSELSEQNFARTLYARCFVGEKKYQKAIELASKIVMSQEACKSAFYYRAIALYHTAQYQEAVNDLSHIIAEEFGILSVESNKEDGKLKICDSIDARILRAQANYKLGDFVNAMRDLDFVIIRRPSMLAYLERSKAALRLSLYGTALGDAQAAVAANALSFEAQHQLKLCQQSHKKQSQFAKPGETCNYPEVFVAT